MKCPACGHEFHDPGRVKGGKTRSPSKGFGTPFVLAKAIETRRRNREKFRKNENDATI